MNLPDQPNTFRQPGPAERPWHWRLEDAAGAEVEVDGAYAGRRFATQADAESWVGEIWSGLADEGVYAVTLLEHERVVYGPMPLHE
jgi:hypothetical protein